MSARDVLDQRLYVNSRRLRALCRLPGAGTTRFNERSWLISAVQSRGNFIVSFLASSHVPHHLRVFVPLFESLRAERALR